MSILEVGRPLGGLADQVFTRVRPLANVVLGTPSAGRETGPCTCEPVIVDRELTRC